VYLVRASSLPKLFSAIPDTCKALSEIPEFTEEVRKMRILLKDGIKYLPYKYKDENELERMVVEHSEVMFGVDSIFFPKQKIKARSGIATIPDGFILLMNDEKWYILEVELASHPLYEHIVVQVSKFNTAIKNSKTRKKLIDVFYDEVRDNIQIKYKFEFNRIMKESYKFLSDTISKGPEVIVVVDEKTRELDEVCGSLPFRTTVLRFGTYYREKIGVGVHTHSFDTLRDYGIEGQIPSREEEKEVRKSTPTGRVETGVAATERKTSWIDYCKEALENLGNRASLKDIYGEVDQLRTNAGERKIENLGAAVRNTLEKNSRGKGQDMFGPEEIGSGIWLLKT